MTILLRVSLLIDLDDGNIDQFYTTRNAFLSRIAEEFGRYEPIYADYALYFHGLQPSERKLVQDRCRELDRRSDCQPKAVYTREEIAGARFVPLLVAGEELDRDEQGQSLNIYSKRLCCACGSYDLEGVPDPYIICRPDCAVDIALSVNGIRIISSRLWHALKPTLGAWVRSGRVAYDDSPADLRDEFVWIMPKHVIGPYSNADIRKLCEICGRATEVRMATPNDPLMWTVDVVADAATPAPIALVGNWYGELRIGETPRLHWPIVISGALHEKLRAMDAAGLVAADRIVETEAEFKGLGVDNV